MQCKKHGHANSYREKWRGRFGRDCGSRGICSSAVPSKPPRPKETSATSGQKRRGWDTSGGDQPLAPSIPREGPTGFGVGWATPAQDPAGRAAAALAPHCSQGSSTARKYGLIKKKEGLLCLASEFHLPPGNMQNHLPLRGPLII